MDNQNLLDLLNQRQRTLTPSHSRIANYLLSSGHKAAFLTAADIAADVEVSESTVVRFARILGFRGFPELQGFLRSGLLATLSPADRLKGQSDVRDAAQLIKLHASMEALNLQTAVEQIDPDAIQALTDSICSARTCYVVGLRSSRAPAMLLAHYLGKFISQVSLIVSGDFVFEQLSWSGNQDVLIAYSFPRYSIGTIDAIRVAKSLGVTTAAITDSPTSPAAQVSKISIIAPATSSFFGNSFVGAVAVTNLLLAACARADPERIQEGLVRVEAASSLADRFFSVHNDNDKPRVLRAFKNKHSRSAEADNLSDD